MIPTNLLFLIGTKLSKEDVYTYCQLNKTTRNICQSEFFWPKLLHEQYGDFFIVTKPNDRNLVEWYRYLMNFNIFNNEPEVILDLAEKNGLLELKNYIQSSLHVDSLILNKNYGELGKTTIDRDILFISVKAWKLLLNDNKYNIISWLLETGANIHVDSDFPLIRATYWGDTDLVKLLLENGANLHADDDGALRWASLNGHTEIIKLLLEYKANIHAHNDQALRWASRNGYTEIVQLLLEYNANVHANNDQALIWARNTEIVKLLLENKADIHANNDEALRWARNTEIVKLLLENKADIHANNDQALRDASMEGRTEIVKLLLKYGANPHANNDEPLKLAQKNGHADIVKLLKAAMYSLIYSTKVGNMMLLNDINRLMYF